TVLPRNTGRMPVPPGKTISACYPAEKTFELLAAHRVLQLADGLGFDLPDPLAGDLEDTAHLFERVGVAVPQPVAQADDLPLAIRQGFEQSFDLVPQHALSGGGQGAERPLILQKLAEAAV